MDYKVTDTQLTNIANAIRTKGGTSEQLEFPTEFIDAIDDISGITAADEGKVVSNGALVTQTSTTVTQNGTYDTTENDEVVVNVSGGGGTNVYNWKRFRQVTHVSGGSMSFDTDNTFSITANSSEASTYPQGNYGNDSDLLNVNYPVAAGQKVTLTWDTPSTPTGSNATANNVFIFENKSTDNMAYAKYVDGQLEHTVVTGGFITMRFGNRVSGTALKYENCSLVIE